MSGRLAAAGDDLGARSGAGGRSPRLRGRYRRWFTDELPERDLVGYLSRFDVSTSVMQTKEALERIAFELVEDAAAENVWYLDALRADSVDEARALSAAGGRRGSTRARAGHEAHPGFSRTRSSAGCFEPERALRMAALAVEYKDRGVLAFDLAGAEIDNPAKWFREAFYLVRDANLNVTVHAVRRTVRSRSTRRCTIPGHIASATACGFVRRGPARVRARSSDSARNVSVVERPDRRSRFDRGASHREYFDRGLRVAVNTDNRSCPTRR